MQGPAGRSENEALPVLIYRTYDWWRAQMIREALEAQGIPVVFEGETALKVLGYRDAFEEVRVFVAESNAARARKIVDRYFGQDDPKESSGTEANE